MVTGAVAMHSECSAAMFVQELELLLELWASFVRGEICCSDC